MKHGPTNRKKVYRKTKSCQHQDLKESPWRKIQEGIQHAAERRIQSGRTEGGREFFAGKEVSMEIKALCKGGETR